jgi:DNA-binding protein HU-beta
MTKEQVTKKIAEETGVTIKKAKVALAAVLDAITDSLKKKEKVTFTGFGTFNVVKKKARKGKNPKTMAVINIPAKTVPLFKAGKSLKDQVKK